MSRIEIKDKVVPGLYLRKSRDNRGTWIFRKRIDGKQKTLTLATWPTVGEKEARKLAATAEIEARRGVDVTAERKERVAQRKAVEAQPTLGECLEAYRVVMDGKRTGERIMRDLTRVLAPLADRKAPAINTVEIMKILNEKATTHPRMAGLLFEMIRPFWGWMRDTGRVPSNIMLDTKKPGRKEARDRYLDKAELKAVYASCDEMGTLWGPLVRLLVLTAQRRENVASMAWEEVDLDRQLWTIPKDKAKTGVDYVVPLPSQACDILRDIGPGEGPVFGNPSGFSKMKKKLDAVSGVSDWVLHDLRRTFATQAAGELKISDTVADKCLNHVGAGTSGTVKRVYQKYQMLDERRDALQAWGNFIERLVGGASENVIQLRM